MDSYPATVYLCTVVSKRECTELFVGDKVTVSFFLFFLFRSVTKVLLLVVQSMLVIVYCRYVYVLIPKTIGNIKRDCA